MMRRDTGFTLLEMMLTIAIVSLVLFAAITFFTAVVRQYKVQTKITETNVEGMMGLELLRQDVESLGFGLPWNNVAPYNEAVSGIQNDSPASAPRAIVSVSDPSSIPFATVNNSSYLVIKSASVGSGAAAGKWTTLKSTGAKRNWGSAEENLSNADFVIVLSPGNSDASWRSLVAPLGTFSVLYSGTNGYAPLETYDTNLVYGIGAQALRFPFNRADYYIDNTAIPVPRHCAPVTGTLVKSVVRNSTGASGGTLEAPLPLLDCAADLQLVYGLDNNADGQVDTWSNDISTGMTAGDIRSQVTEIRLHVLAQEGQRDDSYRTPSDIVFVGSQGVGRNFNLAAYRNYRWKLYNIVVKPTNLAR